MISDPNQSSLLKIGYFSDPVCDLSGSINQKAKFCNLGIKVKKIKIKQNKIKLAIFFIS